MSKQAGKSKRKDASGSTGSRNTGETQPPTAYTFPAISSKDYLECRVLLEDQILLIDNFLTAAECRKYIQFIENLPLELTPPKKRGEASRVNYRMSIASVDFAQHLFTVLNPHVPPLPTPSTSRIRNTLHSPISCNPNIRLYKYVPGQYFGAHYDDSVKDPTTGTKSEWTILVYLSGIEDSVEGGETTFYSEKKGEGRKTTTADLTRGTALLHRHGADCLLHEGSPVRKGIKYILRSDLMFKE